MMMAILIVLATTLIVRFLYCVGRSSMAMMLILLICSNVVIGIVMVLLETAVFWFH